MSLIDVELVALVTKWRAKARTYRVEARRSESVRDIHRLAAMASSWEFAARDLCEVGGVNPTDGSQVANAEADRAALETFVQLTRDVGKSQP
jgi:hypothetical protein